MAAGPYYFAGQAGGADTFPPGVQSASTTPSAGLSGSNFTIKATVIDPSNVSTVTATIQYPDEVFIANVTLFDDGLHDDGAANDSMYANTWNSTGQLNGTYYIDVWANDTLGNMGETENIRFFIVGEANATGLFDGLYINWTGTYNVVSTLPWNGSENYQFLEGNAYRNSHVDSMLGAADWDTDNATRILNTPNSFWGNNVHDHMFIALNTAVNDRIMVNFQGFDRVFLVNAIKYINALGTSLECWELFEESGPSVLYYETATGLLINGTFDYNFGGYYYSIIINSTNAQFGAKPVFNVLEPKNQTYHYSTVPIIISNSTPLVSAWYRNSTNGITWSNNQTLTSNGTHYIDLTTSWGDGVNVVQIFGNNSFDFTMMQEIWFTVDTYGPWTEILSSINITYLYRALPVIVFNYTTIDYIAYRYNSGGGWSSNFTLNWNGTCFIDESVLWPDGFYHLQVFANDSTTEMSMREVWFRVIATYPLNISHNSQDNVYPKIIVSSPGDVHIFWANGGGGMPYAEIIHDNNLNGHFGNHMNISQNPEGDDVLVDVTTDASETIHAVWSRTDFMRPQMIILRYSNNSGGAFNPSIEIGTSSYYNMVPNIEVDSNNIVHVIWMGFDMPKNRWTLFYTNNTGGTFNTPINISSSLYNVSMFSSMGIDNNDVLHIAYVSYINGNKEIMYQNISNGISSTPVNISKRSGSDITPALVVNSTGTVHIVWRGEGTAPSESEIFYSHNSAGTFSIPFNISQDSVSSDVHPSIAIDETPDSDIIFISWSYNTTFVMPGSQMQIVMVNNTLGSFGEKVEITPLMQFVNASYLAVDSVRQEVHIVWMAFNDYLTETANIYYTYLNYSYPPEFALLNPQNQTYNYQTIPVLLQNNTHVDSMWFRNNTGTGWSANQTLSYNGSHFMNQSNLVWADGAYHVQIFGNESGGFETMIEEWFTVDSQSPSGVQWLNTSFNSIQTGSVIWINGTASDPAPSSGLSSSNIFVSGSNTSATWSTNVGSASNWAFYNTSPIQEIGQGQQYQMNLSITDNAGNDFILTGDISVDATPPSGSQFLNNTNPQNAVGGIVWVNGSAVDFGIGLKSVTIIGDNVTGGTTWSANQGSNSSWSFSNTSAILDTPASSVYEVLIEITDQVNNTIVISAFIVVDTITPTGIQSIVTTLPQNGGGNQYIWINGTASDTGTGVSSISIIGDNVTGGTTWSANLGTLLDWSFRNTSAILDTPSSNIYEVLINVTDNAGNSRILSCEIFVDTVAPNGTQSASTYYTTIQTVDVNGRIWINGTASDFGAGLQSVSIQSNNVTGGSSWINVGTPSNWAFYNSTPIQEPPVGEKYLIEINLTDLANNSELFDCYISVDITGPSLTQNQSTIDAQSGAVVWVNGTAFDVWVDVQSVSIIDSNLTTPATWTSNIGINESWSFTNTSAVVDGYWEIVIQAIDGLANVRNFTAIILIDNVAPTEAVVSYVLSGSNLTLTWLPASDLTNVTYIIYQNGSNIANTTTLYYQLFDLPDGQYIFIIRAIDDLGHISADSNTITIQIGSSGGEPPDPFMIIIIIAIGAAVGILAGIVAYRRGRGGLPPLIVPKKPSWVSKAIGYSPEFEQKLERLSKVPKKLVEIRDPELDQFFRGTFTALPGSIITQLDQILYTENEKIEILKVLLVLTPDERQQLLAELMEDQHKEAAS